MAGRHPAQLAGALISRIPYHAVDLRQRPAQEEGRIGEALTMFVGRPAHSPSVAGTASYDNVTAGLLSADMPGAYQFTGSIRTAVGNSAATRSGVSGMRM